mgnify:CR=1 FL=1
MELPIPDGARLSGSDWGRAAVLSARSVFLVQRPPFLACPGVSWHVLAFQRRTQQTQGTRNNAQPRLVAYR